MSYYEGRSLILGGLFELGLSFVIKVSLEFSRVFWKNNLCLNDWFCVYVILLSLNWYWLLLWCDLIVIYNIFGFFFL